MLSPRIAVAAYDAVGVVNKTECGGFLYGFLVTVTSVTYGINDSVFARRVSSRLLVVSNVVDGVVKKTGGDGFL